MEKYILLIVGIIWMVGNTCGVRYCPSNCDCSSEFWSTCEILYCDDDLDIETPFLTIIGRLCPRYYDMLRNTPNLYKQLHNSYCLSRLNASEYSVYICHTLKILDVQQQPHMAILSVDPNMMHLGTNQKMQ